jgi:hypothetical protein
MNVLSEKLRGNIVLCANLTYPGPGKMTFKKKDLALAFVRGWRGHQGWQLRVGVAFSPALSTIRGYSVGSQMRQVILFEGALVSASSLGLASFFGSIISHFRSYHNTTTSCSHHHLSSDMHRYQCIVEVDDFHRLREVLQGICNGNQRKVCGCMNESHSSVCSGDNVQLRVKTACCEVQSSYNELQSRIRNDT